MPKEKKKLAGKPWEGIFSRIEIRATQWMAYHSAPSRLIIFRGSKYMNEAGVL